MQGPLTSAVAEATQRMTYREALRLAMREELARDERVFIEGEEEAFQAEVTAGLMDEFGPSASATAPISEEGFVGAAVGAAMGGERPIVEIMTINFLLVAIDQVVNHAAKVRTMFGGEVGCPMVIGRRARQPAHRRALRSCSKALDTTRTTGAPSNPAEAKGLLKAAVLRDHPVLVVETRRSTRRRARSRSIPSSSL